MEHLASLAVAVMETEKAYDLAHHNAWGVTDPMEKVKLDLIKNRALNTFCDAKRAYERALDEHNQGAEIDAQTMRAAE